MSPVNSSGEPAVVSGSHSDASHASSRNSAISSASSSVGLHVSSSGEPASPNSSEVSKQEKPVMKKSAYDFIFGKLIGEGSFSMVYLAKDVHTEREYAIKVCDKLHILREKKQKAVMREKQIMNILNNHPSPFFIKLYCAFQDLDRLYFVMNYAINGEMLPYINKVGSFDAKCSQFYAAEIVLALEHLKKLGIVHRDLKPENILLDENMHIQITDFGSAKVLEPDPVVDKGNSENESGHKDDANKNKNKDGEAEGNTKYADKGSNKGNKSEGKVEDDDDNIEIEEPSVKLKRRHSFVGTAQYVSPEILTGKSSSCSSDLWALGCIVYQMITGLTPFHAPNEYMMFQKIQKAEYSFPDNFPSDAKDLVKRLLVIKSSERLGASDMQGYPSLKNHPFLNGMPWETLHECTPPCIFKSKGATSNGEQQMQYKVPDNLEPGLDEKQMTRLLGLGLNEDVKKDSRTSSKTIIDLSPEEIAEKLELQAKDNIWHKFVEGNVILMHGLVNKQKVGKGLFPRRRMLLLTTGPHLYYVDPVNMVLKGEIPWTSELRTEAKSFKMFSINTPDRSYNMEDPEANALKWCKAIEEVHKKTFGEQS